MRKPGASHFLPFPAFSMPRAVTRGPHEHLLANYFGINAWSPDSRYLLALETDIVSGLPDGRPCTVGLVDLEDGNRFIPVMETRAWNFQEAAMAHWLPHEPDTFVVNDLRGGRFVALVRNWRTGAERVIPHPVSAVSQDGTWALSINYARLYLARPDYGYAGDGQDPRRGVAFPEDDGLWRVDMRTGEARLIVSCASLRDKVPDVPPSGMAYVCHTVVSKDMKRVFFLLRSVSRSMEGVKTFQGVNWKTTAFTCNADGSGIRRCFPDGWGASHFNWKPALSERDARTMAVTCDWRGEGGWAHVEFTVGEEDKVRRIGDDSTAFDGHCIYSPDGQFVCGDGYWDEAGFRHWKIIRLADNAVRDIGDFFVPQPYRETYSRCDLHPRWRSDGRALAFNSVHEGSRQIYLMGVVTTAAAHFSDNGRALVNPGMGWTMHYYSNVPKNYGSLLPQGDSAEWFPGCSTVYLRIPWAFVEPEEGRFNWNSLDTPAQRWIERGGQVAFRITCSESWLEYATPKWVFDAGARAVRYNFGFGESGGPRHDGRLVDPDYADPVFLAKLDAFLSAFAARYDGRPEVAFVDVGSYGTWGEGHTHGATRVPQDKTDIDARLHINLYRKHFRRTWLVLGDDISGWDNPDPEPPLISYARSLGLAWRDDSLLVQPPPRSWCHAAQAELFWRTTPVILEHQHYRESLRDGAWDPELLVRAVEEHHASFLSIHGNPRDIFEGNRDAIDRINRRIGYRFVPEEVEWPDTVVVGEGAEPFEVRWRFRNAGVAPAYRPCYPCLTVKDHAGAIVAVLAGAECDLSKIVFCNKGHKWHKDFFAAPASFAADNFVASFTLGRWVAPLTLPGDYDVWLSVGEADGTPRIALPIDAEDDGHRRYRCGTIHFRHAF